MKTTPWARPKTFTPSSVVFVTYLRTMPRSSSAQVTTSAAARRRYRVRGVMRGVSYVVSYSRPQSHPRAVGSPNRPSAVAAGEGEGEVAVGVGPRALDREPR